jgi:hypothetical protein
MSPLMGNRSRADEKDQRQSRRTRKNRLPLQSLHLQELQLLNDRGRTSQGGAALFYDLGRLTPA